MSATIALWIIAGCATALAIWAWFHPLKKRYPVVTWNEAGQIVCVTLQDDEGKIVRVLAESANPPITPRAKVVE